MTMMARSHRIGRHQSRRNELHGMVSNVLIQANPSRAKLPRSLLVNESQVTYQIRSSIISRVSILTSNDNQVTAPDE